MSPAAAGIRIRGGGGPARREPRNRPYPPPPPLPPPRICSSEKQPSRSECLSRCRSGEGSESWGSVDPGRVRLRLADPPGPGRRAVRALGHPAALLACDASRVAAEVPRAGSEGGPSRPFAGRRRRGSSSRGGLGRVAGALGRVAGVLPETAGTETRPPSPSPHSFFFFFGLTFPTCFLRTELWEDGPREVRTVNPSNQSFVSVSL